jgi:hypothetical protein
MADSLRQPSGPVALDPDERPYVSGYRRGAPRPKIGTQWIWEPNKPHAYAHVEVVEVKWNGEEWWIGLRDLGGDRYWNDLDRFWEACVAIS